MARHYSNLSEAEQKIAKRDTRNMLTVIIIFVLFSSVLRLALAML